ncbi:MAG: Na(+)-translocating NADH-quinone reductase subunit C [Pseudomonadota bacterium]
MPDDQLPDEQPAKQKGPIGRFLAAPPDSIGKTIFVAVGVCLVASMVVSSVAVSLRPTQEVNQLKDKQINILQVAGVYDPEVDVVEAFNAFEPQVLELETGQFTDQFDATSFDDIAAADDPATSVELSDDPAGIGRKATFRTVYLLRNEDGSLDKAILPLHGYGLWSTLYGYIAIEEDGNEIYGLQFYSHAETPGLGAEVDNPRWKSQWNGKRLKDEDGNLAITVAKAVPPQGEDYHIDALAGATLTTVGVDNLVRFWMGEEGYTPFLQKLKTGGI